MNLVLLQALPGQQNSTNLIQLTAAATGYEVTASNHHYWQFLGYQCRRLQFLVQSVYYDCYFKRNEHTLQTEFLLSPVCIDYSSSSFFLFSTTSSNSSTSSNSLPLIIIENFAQQKVDLFFVLQLCSNAISSWSSTLSFHKIQSHGKGAAAQTKEAEAWVPSQRL